MKYPSFIKQHETIGICAPSSGIGRKLNEHEKSISILHEHGWNTLETKHVRVNALRSASAKTRAEEFHELLRNKDVSMIMCACGGDFLNEILPYVDFNLVKENQKWIMGASDPTSLLFPITTGLDIATIYGNNASSFSFEPNPPFLENCLEIVSGSLVTQTNDTKYMEGFPEFGEPLVFSEPSALQASVASLHETGRCIGGCIDGLKDLIGTPYDHTKEFVERYQNDGIIWYFDNFALSAENLYRTLLQMRYAGWFKTTKAVIMGRTIFPSSETGMSYADAMCLAFPDIPYIEEADVGHTFPHMTMINGALLHLDYEDTMTISFELK